MSADLSARFALPTQDRKPASLPRDAGALTQWLESLPKTNLGQTTRALYETLTDLNRVALAPAQRLQLLDVLRPAIDFAAAGLRRHYLNQPLLLPEQAQKVTRLAQVLRHEMALGYTLVAVQALENERASGFAQPRQGTATALHRAMVEQTFNLLREMLLYRDPGNGVWRGLHQLAALAWERQLEKLPVTDPQAGDSTLEAAYLRALLLGTARVHALRQDDLLKMFDQLLGWSRRVTLCGADAGLFVIDRDGDDGPINREHYRGSGPALGLDTRALGAHLEQQRAPDDEALPLRGALGNDLLAHLAHAWSTPSSRAFVRMPRDEEIEIALGLSATHHYCAGELDFALLLSKSGFAKVHQPQDNPFLPSAGPAREKRGRDIWDSPYLGDTPPTPATDTIEYTLRQTHRETERGRASEKFRAYTVRTRNASPGGFCLQWPAANAVQMRTGEIVGIREHNHKSWRVGVIRWVRLSDSGPQLGVELLSPTASAFGARVIPKSGPQGECLRVLVLPAMKQSGLPATLITPRLPFRTGQKVMLVYRDRETRIQLVRRRASTAAFSQFEFRRLDTAKPAESGSKTPGADAGFDSLWELL